MADPGGWYRIEKRTAEGANALYNDIAKGRKIWEGISGLEVAREDVYVWVRVSDPSASTPEGLFPEVDDDSDDGGLTGNLDIPIDIPEEED